MNNDNEKNQQPIRVPGWAASLMILVFVAIMAVVLYLQFQRYKFIGESLKRGDTASAALLFTPEISTSIASLLYN